MEQINAKQIEEWLEAHRAEMVEDIFRIVRIPSVSDAASPVKPYGQPCRDVLDEMLNIAREHGFHTRNFDYQCGCMWLGEEEIDLSDAIAFWGHLDVVPASGEWNFSPFEPFERNGFLVGRGVDDNKGPAVAAMYVIRCLHELGVSLTHPLCLFVGCDEEVGMRDLEYYTKNHPCPRLSIVSDCGFPVCYAEKGIIEANLISEPLSDEILSLSGGLASNIVPDRAEICLKKSERVINQLSMLPHELKYDEQADEVRITAHGVAAHTAFPEGGVNAIAQLAKGLVYANLLNDEDAGVLQFFCEATQDFYGRGLRIMQEDDLSGKLTCVGSVCSLDDQHRARLHFNIRYPVKADSDAIIKQIAKIAELHGFSFELIRDSKPNDFPKEHPAVDYLTDLFNRVTGSDTKPYVMGGGTYARKLPRAFAFGPGMPESGLDRDMFPEGHGSAHGPDEALNLSNLLTAMKIYCLGIPEVDRMEL